ncbi:Phosphoribosyl 1,2-cyclic phosphodiesterase [Malonomonas rubra DSM 5091]|uniref:Phosphoribosyl 1,2-cyclic phosphodiesterase n=1 Tax=Malonomonas rubra DSM 5091 TaxID=1122189 RepID=A0A1M6KAJ0_MALRU|nr:MBL fold metallo-hydrolase [Malonomonas rubra]SHJ55936.1 Phosphoribosyl 1,2-cyclic phosphodiesterase [Malonomonas rubra DSM 5091]
MRVCLLASGSRGNSALIEADNCRILVDAGLSGREIEKRLASLELAGEDLDAILVTHEHHDHVGGVGPLARRFDLPVYIDQQTHAALPKLGKIARLELFDAGDTFSFRDLEISSFSTTHDAINPVGYVIESDEGKVGYATDLGMSTRLVSDQLKACRVLILEANHDEQMLLDGPYPWPLKQRIRSRHGHLSNNESRRLLEDVNWSGLEALFLAHLSEENNCPDLVAETFRQFMLQSGHTPEIIVGRQHQASSCFVGALL